MTKAMMVTKTMMMMMTGTKMMVAKMRVVTKAMMVTIGHWPSKTNNLEAKDGLQQKKTLI